MSKETIMIKRSFDGAEMRASEADGASIIEGHPAIYNKRAKIGNYFYEVIEPGAFDGCDLDDVLFCVNHDMSKIPLARSRRNNGNSTMKLTTDAKGLHMRAEVDVENNAEARAVYNSIKRGDIDGMSFLFYVESEKWENLLSNMPTRRIQKFKRIREVSAVNSPAYSGTDINARDQASLDNAALTLENARSQLDNSENELEILRLKHSTLLKGQGE